jgi:hypothetical protein
MKKLLFHLLACCLGFSALAQPDIDSLPPTSAMEFISWSIGQSFKKEIRKAGVPVGCKIYALPFRCERAGQDTFKTPLGMKISADLSFRFKRLAQDRKLRKLKLEIVSPDNENKQLFELMARNLTPPATMAEESEFWKTVSQGQKPDYFLVGKYEILGDYKGVRVTKVELVKDVLNPKLKNFSNSIALRSAEFDFEDDNEREQFRKLSGSVAPVDDQYVRLMRLTSRGQFASVKIVDEKTDKAIPLDVSLQTGKGYQLQVDLAQDAYLYAFYYESHDLTGNKMYMIYPFESGQKNFMSKGTVTLPDDENVFSPSEPAANQVFIKLIASKKKLPLNITTSPEGYKYLSPDDCFRFVSAMEKIPLPDIDSNNIIRGVE